MGAVRFFARWVSSKMPSGSLKPALALLKAIWYRNRPAPPRKTVLPLPNRSEAKPKRGSMKNGFDGKPDTGMLGSMPCHSSPVQASAGLAAAVDELLL